MRNKTKQKRCKTKPKAGGTKPYQVSLRQFHFHEPLTTILNQNKHVGSEPFWHVISFAANMRKRLTSHMFRFGLEWL
jgi:hypothetical protein